MGRGPSSTASWRRSATSFSVAALGWTAYVDAFAPADPADAPSVYERLRKEWVAARAILVTLDLQAVYVHPDHGPMSLRWLYIHLIREYAGHIGHADLLRQSIDGRTFG